MIQHLMIQRTPFGRKSANLIVGRYVSALPQSTTEYLIAFRGNLWMRIARTDSIGERQRGAKLPIESAIE